MNLFKIKTGAENIVGWDQYSDPQANEREDLDTLEFG